MAFVTDDVKTCIACKAAFSWAEKTLTDWLAGREKAYAVHAVINELQELFGPGAAQSVTMIEKALTVDPDAEAARLRLVTKALDLLGQQARAFEALTHVPYRD